jgi:hypothetical protein
MPYQVYEDEHVAGVYRALSLRFHIRYVDMLSSADSFAGKTIDHGLLPTRRYRRAVDEWVRKPAESAHAASGAPSWRHRLRGSRSPRDPRIDPGGPSCVRGDVTRPRGVAVACQGASLGDGRGFLFAPREHPHRGACF